MKLYVVPEPSERWTTVIDVPGRFLPLLSFSIAGAFHLIPLDPQVYAVSYVPFHPSVWDGFWITLVAMGISVGATLLPAKAASKLLPVEILRYE